MNLEQVAPPASPGCACVCACVVFNDLCMLVDKLLRCYFPLISLAVQGCRGRVERGRGRVGERGQGRGAGCKGLMHAGERGWGVNVGRALGGGAGV